MNNNTAEVAAVLGRLAGAIAELKSLGVVRSRKVASDYGEWIAGMVYEGTMAESKTQQGWDIQLGNENVQVKVASVPESTPNRWSYVNDPASYDSLILLVLSDKFRVKKFYKVPSSDVKGKMKKDS